MKFLKLFTKEDFLPHPLDGEKPLLSRIYQGDLGVISLKEQTMDIFKVSVEKSIVRSITYLETQDTTDFSKVSATFDYCIVKLASGNCPTRESLDVPESDLELYKLLKNSPKSLLKDFYLESNLYSIVSSKKSSDSIIFSEPKQRLSQIEACSLNICRINNGIYAGLSYLNSRGLIEDGICVIADQEAILFLRVKLNKWEQISYRKFKDKESLQTICKEVLPAMGGKNSKVFFVDDSGFNVDEMLAEYEYVQLMKDIDNPLIWSSLHG